MFPFLLNTSKSVRYKLALLCLGLSLNNAGCQDDFFDIIDDVLDGRCKSGAECLGPGDSTTGAQQGSSTHHAGSGVSNATAASTEKDDSSLDQNTGDHTGKESSEGAQTSSGCDDNDSTAPECEDGATQDRECSYCGTQAQVCENGRWKDVGECTDQADNYPGELRTIQNFAKFDCGSYWSFWTYNDQCRPIDSELPTVYVSYCKPTECCGFGSTVPPSCLDPNNLPGDAECKTGPPSPAELGTTWMTTQMWEEYYESIKTQPPQD